MADSLLNNPVYLHLATNHLPVIGLGIAWIVLVYGALARDRACAILGMVLVCGTAGSTLLVVEAGEEAYRMVLPALDGPARERLDRHADLAGEFAYGLYLLAGLAMVGTLGAILKPTMTTPAASLLGVATTGILFSAAAIAQSGGEIRHVAGAHSPSQSRPVPVAGDFTGAEPPILRLLTAAQYRQSIAKIFSPEITIPDRFPPALRRSGLIALGRSKETITPSGMERYIGMATSVAQQAVSGDHRARLIPCGRSAGSAEVDRCDQVFLQRVASELFRRKVGAEEIAERLEILEKAAPDQATGTPATQAVLTSLLLSPEFLFRVEQVSPKLLGGEVQALADETLAAKISYLLINDAPDQELREAAARGELQDDQLLARQVDRLLGSSEIRKGLRAFFSDMLRLSDLGQASKDVSIYPAFDRALVDDSREQTLLVLMNHLLDQDRDYRDLFTTSSTYLNRTLGPVYRVPVSSESDWELRDFPPGHIRSGILSHPSFHIQHSHADRSSATLRGQFVRETLLCQPVPPAPADVDFSLFDDDQNPVHATARDRLSAHSSEGSCRACHRLTDPIGLGLEVFDAVGQLRDRENGSIIDVSGELDGVEFRDSAELGQAIRNHPGLAPCLVETLYRYAAGREISDGEIGTIQRLQADFATTGYRILPLLRAISLSQAFRKGSLAEQLPVANAPKPASQRL